MFNQIYQGIRRNKWFLGIALGAAIMASGIYTGLHRIDIPRRLEKVEALERKLEKPLYFKDISPDIIENSYRLKSELDSLRLSSGFYQEKDYYENLLNHRRTRWIGQILLSSIILNLSYYKSRQEIRRRKEASKKVK